MKCKDDQDKIEAPPMEVEVDERAEKLQVDAARELILRRRNRFVAAAIAGLGATATPACDDATVCLSVVPKDAGQDPGPRVCLDLAPPMHDGGKAPPDAGDRDAEVDSSAPSVCLNFPVEASPELDAGDRDAEATSPAPAVCLDLAVETGEDDGGEPDGSRA